MPLTRNKINNIVCETIKDQVTTIFLDMIVAMETKSSFDFDYKVKETDVDDSLDYEVDDDGYVNEDMYHSLVCACKLLVAKYLLDKEQTEDYINMTFGFMRYRVRFCNCCDSIKISIEFYGRDDDDSSDEEEEPTSTDEEEQTFRIVKRDDKFILINPDKTESELNKKTEGDTIIYHSKWKEFYISYDWVINETTIHNSNWDDVTDKYNVIIEEETTNPQV